MQSNTDGLLEIMGWLGISNETRQGNRVDAGHNRWLSIEIASVYRRVAMARVSSLEGNERVVSEAPQNLPYCF